MDIEQAKAMAQVCLDLHAALGVDWGSNPYARITELKAAERALAEAQQARDGYHRELCQAETDRDNEHARAEEAQRDAGRLGTLLGRCDAVLSDLLWNDGNGNSLVIDIRAALAARRQDV